MFAVLMRYVWGCGVGGSAHPEADGCSHRPCLDGQEAEVDGVPGSRRTCWLEMDGGTGWQVGRQVSAMKAGGAEAYN